MIGRKLTVLMNIAFVLVIVTAFVLEGDVTMRLVLAITSGFMIGYSLHEGDRS